MPAAYTPPTRLLNRSFVLLWQGQLVSSLGHQAFMVAMLYGTMELTGSGSTMGLLMMLSSLPGLLFGPIGGAIADRYSRRALIVGSDLLLGLGVLALAALAVGGTVDLLVPGLAVYALCLGLVSTVFQPAVMAAVPDLVPPHQIAAANSWRQVSTQATVATGWALGGGLYASLGMAWLLALDGLSYLFSAASESRIVLPRRTPADGSHRDALAATLADTRAGLRYVWHHRGMRDFMLAVAALNFFFMPVFVLLPFYTDGILGAGAAGYGLLMASFSAGSLVGGLMAGIVQPTGASRRRWILGGHTAMAILFGTLGLIDRLPLAAACFAALGFLVAVINIASLTLLQTITPADFRGRVLGVDTALTRAASPIGMGLAGILADLTDQAIPQLFLAYGVAALGVALVMCSHQALRDFVGWDSSHPMLGTPTLNPRRSS
ncbi:MAG: MFS transporter [Acidobacteriota bacterium]